MNALVPRQGSESREGKGAGQHREADEWQDETSPAFPSLLPRFLPGDGIKNEHRRLFRRQTEGGLALSRLIVSPSLSVSLSLSLSLSLCLSLSLSPRNCRLVLVFTDESAHEMPQHNYASSKNVFRYPLYRQQPLRFRRSVGRDKTSDQASR